MLFNIYDFVIISSIQFCCYFVLTPLLYVIYYLDEYSNLILVLILSDNKIQYVTQFYFVQIHINIYIYTLINFLSVAFASLLILSNIARLYC